MLPGPRVEGASPDQVRAAHSPVWVGKCSATAGRLQNVASCTDGEQDGGLKAFFSVLS
jgi:hypothetical protein